MDTVSNSKNYLGPDKHGSHWFSRTLPDGNQVWAWTRGNIIRDAGLNNISRSYNPATGLCKLSIGSMVIYITQAPPFNK